MSTHSSPTKGVSLILTESEQEAFARFYESIQSRDIWVKMTHCGVSERETWMAISLLRRMYEQVQAS